MWTAIAMTIAAIISAIVVGVTNTKNAESVDATNQANIEQVKLTNQANAEQANLAYKRSLPAQQISDMMSAGISKSAAIQRITGGGTYSMPTMQAASVQPKHFDYSGIGDAMERLSGIPSSVQQFNLQREQLNSLRTEIQLKKDANRREEEQHQFDMWQKHYGKDAALAIDDLSNRIAQKAADKGINLDSIDTIDKLVTTFDLQNDKVWRDMPNLARSQVVEAVHRQAEENRSRRSSQDSHDLAEKEKILKQIDIDLRKIDKKYYDREKHAQLLGLMRQNENLLQDGKIKFQDARSKEFENYVREAGIDSEAEARSLAEYLKVLSNEDEIDLQMRRRTANKNTLGTWNQTRVLLRDLGELLFHVKLGS